MMQQRKLRNFTLEGGVIHRADGTYFIGGTVLEPAVDWLWQILYSHIGQNVRITVEELPTEIRPS